MYIHIYIYIHIYVYTYTYTYMCKYPEVRGVRQQEQGVAAEVLERPRHREDREERVPRLAVLRVVVGHHDVGVALPYTKNNAS